MARDQEANSADDLKSVSFNGCYDLHYDSEEATVTFHDVETDVYYPMEHQRFSAFIKSAYGDKAEQVTMAVYSFKQLRIIPKDGIVAVKTPAAVNYEAVMLGAMFESAGMTFKSEEEYRRHYADKYSIDIPERGRSR